MNIIDQSSGFSTQRVLMVTKRFWVLNQKKWLIGFAGGVGILVIIYLLNSVGPTANINSGIAVVGIGLTLYKFGGYFLTSGIFNEVGKKSSASQMLTLPASTLEKLVSGWFLSYFLYTIFVVGLLYILSIVFEINPNLTTLQLNDPLVNMSNVYFLDVLLTYTAVHSVFFLGSIYFDGYNFLKTLLGIVLFFSGLGIITVLFLASYNEGSNDIVSFSVNLGFNPSNLTVTGALVKLGVAVLFLFFSYRQLQSRQIA